MNGIVTRRDVVRERVGNAAALLVLILIAMLALIGPNGLLAWSDQSAQLDAHHARIAALQEERAVLENRVALLDPDSVDPDLATELVRRDLNVVHRDEVIVELDPVD
ncbi:FtsB family cell division protein [Aurantiacibacter aquimixticola]|uniref:Septum formation initiator n=1 Tax=Aurantiacibacter aquimixticola TaxID=1958945 RepID=A0A419RRX4_9SPHN|nr:septum formation initiator family protein [Aurantiacibacter aquimixticola]RJY08538.1 septum formation initiator [Aurantiacibacter aquimixticola]